MDPLPHIITQVFAAQPYMPPAVINDDDVYLVDLKTLRPIQSYGCSSATAQEVRRGGVPAKLGQGWLKGMQLRHMQAAAAHKNDLLDALQRLLKNDDEFLTEQGLRALAKEAIAKATGATYATHNAEVA